MVDDKVISRIENEIEKLNNKDFTMFFFTVDSKNVPSGMIVYTYEIAYQMKQLGYNVCMLYQVENALKERQVKKLKEKGLYDSSDEQVFCGVGEWMGQEYADLPHINISKQNAWSISPSDMLFIPDALTSLMINTYRHKIPCRRYVLLTNFDYVVDSVPFGTQWSNFAIRDCIATTELQAKLIKDCMPYVSARILNPVIPEYFHANTEPKKLYVNIISKRQSDINKIMKMFYWKYPMYKFISFRDLRGMNREHYAKFLREGAITVWVDDDTPFGYGAIEAMRCNNVVIAKIPDHIQEWMVNKDGELMDNAIWFDSFDMLPDVLADVIGSWMNDAIPQVLYDNMVETNKLYTVDKWKDNVQKLADDLVSTRLNDFKILIANKNNTITTNEQ